MGIECALGALFGGGGAAVAAPVVAGSVGAMAAPAALATGAAFAPFGAAGLAGAASAAGFAGPTMAAAGAGGMVGGVASGMMGAVGTAGLFGGLGSAITQPLMPGLSFTNPLMLGSSAMGLMMGGKSSGMSTVNPPAYSGRGSELNTNLTKTLKANMVKAKSGDVRDKAFDNVSSLRKSEGGRERTMEGVFNTAISSMNNQPPISRGMSVMGGKMVAGQLADASESMQGKFAPISTLNNYRKEELINAARGVNNLYNREANVALQQYGSRLSEYTANQMLSAERGAAIGGIARMIGGTQLNDAYINQRARYL